MKLPRELWIIILEWKKRHLVYDLINEHLPFYEYMHFKLTSMGSENYLLLQGHILLNSGYLSISGRKIDLFRILKSIRR